MTLKLIIITGCISSISKLIKDLRLKREEINYIFVTREKCTMCSKPQCNAFYFSEVISLSFVTYLSRKVLNLIINNVFRVYVFMQKDFNIFQLIRKDNA